MLSQIRRTANGSSRHICGSETKTTNNRDPTKPQKMVQAAREDAASALIPTRGARRITISMPTITPRHTNTPKAVIVIGPRLNVGSDR